ncbi:MAG: HEPN domain-containing protein [Anaerolineae bacterium]|jgi:uncharacterized protein (UPF0332 family)
MTEEEILDRREQIRAYLRMARRALEASASNLEHGFYDTAVNRAYYAIFYATSALLWSRGISRSKHAGVISAFRQYFVKPGIIEPEYSDLYGAVMESRITSDYEITLGADRPIAQKALDAARRFVERVAACLFETEGIQA